MSETKAKRHPSLSVFLGRESSEGATEHTVGMGPRARCGPTGVTARVLFQRNALARGPLVSGMGVPAWASNADMDALEPRARTLLSGKGKTTCTWTQQPSCSPISRGVASCCKISPPCAAVASTDSCVKQAVRVALNWTWTTERTPPTERRNK